MTLLFVWFLTKLEQAEGEEGLGEAERLPGGQASHSAVNQGEAAGRGRRASGGADSKPVNAD